jgi:ubiquinone biosynthesis protein UbiJ
LSKKISIISYFNKILHHKKFVDSIPKDFLLNIDKKIIKIRFLDITHEIFVNIDCNTITLSESSDNHDVEISATLMDFILFIITKGSDKFASKIKINGDIETANKFNSFISDSDKLREIISNIVGERIFIRIESILNNTQSIVNGLVKNLEYDLKDLLIYDLDILPSKKEVDKYINDVDDLKSRTEKLFQKYSND